MGFNPCPVFLDNPLTYLNANKVPHGTIWLVHLVPHGADRFTDSGCHIMLTVIHMDFFTTSASGGSHLPRRH